MEYREGQTATNPKTGQKIVYQGGFWVSAGQQDRSKMLAAPEQRSIEEARASARDAVGVLGDLTRFQDINAGVQTGGLVNNAVNFVKGKLGDPNIQQMDEIKARMAPQQRVPGSGTTSDMDLRLFLQATPSAANSRETNTAIIERGRQEAVRRQQYADFLDQYARENGSLNGAEAAFRAKIGLGSQQNPYSPQDAGDRSKLPRGAYYRDPQGNTRRNDNGPRGNPIIRQNPLMGPQQAKPQARQSKPASGGVLRYDAQGNPI